ncbi:MAG: serine--tRNA ligase [Elusimicrobiota bacterium]|nr:serine--tRNA ligase [Elusimicrobiota bacterium]
MLDIKYIRENQKEVEEAFRARGVEISLSELIQWDKDRRELITEIDKLRAERKKIATEIGSAKSYTSRGEKSTKIKELSKQSEELRDKIKQLQLILVNVEQQIEDFLLRLPNVPDASVPLGSCEKENVVVRESGTFREFNFEVLSHWDIGTALGILDFSLAAKLSGSRFAVLKTKGAQLERALISFMLDLHINEHGYTEIFAPYLVNKKSIIGTGQLPKFEIEVFKCRDDDYYLIPTAEVSVTNIHRDEILDENTLPLKYVSYSACFRREAGSYGKDTKGVIRNHQFNKVELVKFTKPEDALLEFEKLVSDAEEVLKRLQLQYRVVELCRGELGFCSAKTYDLDVWMPGEKMWREVSSCSYFKDYQARRMNIKFRRRMSTGEDKKEFVHTINGSGLAVGRTFAAILENYQNSDGSVTIPEVLRQYTGFDMIK